MSNPVIDIAAKAIVDAMCKRGAGKEEIALAVIVALEKEGYKVIAREPSEEMIRLIRADVEPDSGLDDREIAAEFLRDIFDAAHRYGEPSE